MAYKTKQLHFVLFPFLAQGHMIPMVDIGKLLAQHGHIVTIVTTPINEDRHKSNIARARNLGLQIQFMQLPFPGEEVGLPKDCENMDMLTSFHLDMVSFLDACELLREPVEKLLEKIEPRPCCVIADMCFSYMSDVASKFEIPRIFFNGFSCFCLLCLHKVNNSGILDTATSDSEPFVLPEWPGPDRIDVTKKQLPRIMIKNGSKFSDRTQESEKGSYGTIINSFEELEEQYVKEYKRVKQGKVWCVGPVSLCNKDDLDKSNRGKRTEIGEYCLKWLNSQQPESVIYVCLGTVCDLAITSTQLMELGFGIEASNRPFMWVIKNGDISKDLDKLLQENRFEERTNQRGIVFRGWAPQIAILSHPAIGGFLTHCGWNSTLEAITSGIPMMTLPLFGDQICNQKLVVDVLKIGVRIALDSSGESSEKENKHGLQVNREDVKRAVENLMEKSEESEKLRKRAKELSKIASTALLVDEGSSFRNMKLFIEDIKQFHLRKQENIAQKMEHMNLC